MFFNEKSLSNKTYDYQRSPNLLFGFLSILALAGSLFFIIRPDLSKEISLIREISLYYLNYYEEKVGVLGTGSMYPTFPKGKDQTLERDSTTVVAEPRMLKYPSGIEIFGKKYLDYEIQKGDIVAFNKNEIKNEGEDESGYIKRVIATAGDEVEIRGGLVYLNGKPQLEPYTSKARSTFGGEFLSECTRIKIPENKIFVMGDNRKESFDSRFDLGLIDLSEITNVISWERQQENNLNQYFRDTSNDLEPSSKITLDKTKYLEMVNKQRKSKNLPELKYNQLLEKSASIQSQNSLNSIKRDLVEVMSSVGYRNIIVGSYEIEGYFDAEELFNYQKAFPAEEIDLLTNTEIQEIGIGEVEGNIDSCPKQVISVHVGGYIPPEYDPSTLEILKGNLESMQVLRKSLNDFTYIDQMSKEFQKNFNRIKELVDYRISSYQKVISRIQNNEYLTDQEKRFLDEDENFYQELNERIENLNSF